MIIISALYFLMILIFLCTDFKPFTCEKTREYGIVTDIGLHIGTDRIIWEREQRQGVMKIVNKSINISTGSGSYLEEATGFIRDMLTKAGVKKKEIIKTELLAEETIVSMVKFAPENAELYVRVRHVTGDTCVYLHMKGQEFEPFTEGVGLLGASEDEWDDTSVESIRAILLRAYGEGFKYSHKNGTNRIMIIASRGKQSMVMATVAALVLGILVGLVLKIPVFGPITDITSRYIFSPVKEMFMNALKIVIAPVIFFSLVTCVSQFKNIAELGRMGAKVMVVYLCTTVIAVTNGLFISTVLHPGEWGFALTGAVDMATVTVDTNVETSILSTIINIVPNNFLKPFVESNTLQLMFLAIVCGCALGMIGEYSKPLKELFDACNSLFLTITTMIARFIPVAVFCSVVLLVTELGGESLLSLFSLLLVFILAIFIMITVYGLIVMLVGRQNPITFFKKIWEGMLTSLTLSSSSAAMPTNIRICTEKLGISPRVANFSIPLGATINMDGTCICLSVVGLFLARAYGVEVSASSFISVAITIMVLSLGAPGVPGVGLVCLGIVLRALNVPVEAIGLIVAIDPIMDMISTMSNTTGDMTAALVVAKSEKLIDQEIYNSK